MKTIGTTKDGNAIVEVSPSEMIALQRLDAVTNGTLLSSLWVVNPGENIDDDLTNPFNAIVTWLEVADKSNELRSVAKHLDEALRKTDD